MSFVCYTNLKMQDESLQNISFYHQIENVKTIWGKVTQDNTKGCWDEILLLMDVWWHFRQHRDHSKNYEVFLLHICKYSYIIKCAQWIASWKLFILQINTRANYWGKIFKVIIFQCKLTRKALCTFCINGVNDGGAKIGHYRYLHLELF